MFTTGQMFFANRGEVAVIQLSGPTTLSWSNFFHFRPVAELGGDHGRKSLVTRGCNRGKLTEQIAKLKRLNINSRSITVFTYDDLIRKAKDLYQNIHRKRS